jgi:hypothetical protein
MDLANGDVADILAVLDSLPYASSTCRRPGSGSRSAARPAAGGRGRHGYSLSPPLSRRWDVFGETATAGFRKRRPNAPICGSPR